MNRRFLLALLLAFSLPAGGQTVDPPRFLIDSIRVEGLRYGSERVVIAQSRLLAGRAYTEGELRAGAARAARLAFVVRIELRLERGEERGSYELVLQVIEAKPLFLGVAARAGYEPTESQNITGGGRLFVGRSGMLHGGVTFGDDRNIQLGYTQYDLFGTGTSITALVQRRKLNTPPDPLIEVGESDHLTTQIIAGIPVRGNHALRASWTREPAVIRSSGTGRLPFQVEHVTTSELAWIYDSTDDRLMPASGSVIFGAFSLRRGPYVPSTRLQSQELTHYTRPTFVVQTRRHWELIPRHAVWAGASASRAERGAEVFNQVGQRELQTSVFTHAAAETGYAFMPWAREPLSRAGDLRLDARLLLLAERGSIPMGRAVGTQKVRADTATLSLGLVFRNPWAVVRFHLDAVAGDDEF